MAFIKDALFCLKPRCPHCRTGRLFHRYSVTLVDHCDHCGASFKDQDVGDAAAVLMIFGLGFTFVPLAWAVEVLIGLPIWAHMLIWGSCMMVLIAIFLPAVKAYVMLLDYRHRPRRVPSESE